MNARVAGGLGVHAGLHRFSLSALIVACCKKSRMMIFSACMLVELHIVLVCKRDSIDLPVMQQFHAGASSMQLSLLPLLSAAPAFATNKLPHKICIVAQASSTPSFLLNFIFAGNTHSLSDKQACLSLPPSQFLHTLVCLQTGGPHYLQCPCEVRQPHVFWGGCMHTHWRTSNRGGMCMMHAHGARLSVFKNKPSNLNT